MRQAKTAMPGFILLIFGLNPIPDIPCNYFGDMISSPVMKHYVIDELRPGDYEKLRTCLDERYGPCRMGGIYWIPLPDDLPTGLQASHAECRPHYFAVDLEFDRISFEFLVRSQNRMRCDCIAYATNAQREWLMRFADNLMEELELIT